MAVVFFFGLLIIVIGFITLFYFQRQEKKLGGLVGDLVYKDVALTPAIVLESKVVSLRGKPDAIRKEKSHYIPVEIKTGKTPSKEPYLSHTMQLMAYCLLIEEHYRMRPPGGIIKYPENEFKVAYTKEAEAAVKHLVEELVKHKKAGTEFKCSHPEHQVAAG